MRSSPRKGSRWRRRPSARRGRTRSRSTGVGFVRRECLDHILVLGRRHLQRILGAHIEHSKGLSRPMRGRLLVEEAIAPHVRLLEHARRLDVLNTTSGRTWRLAWARRGRDRVSSVAAGSTPRLMQAITRNDETQSYET
jgi:hypothetical protein